VGTEGNRGTGRQWFASEKPAAIRPYSDAVAAGLVLTNEAIQVLHRLTSIVHVDVENGSGLGPEFSARDLA